MLFLVYASPEFFKLKYSTKSITKQIEKSAKFRKKTKFSLMCGLGRLHVLVASENQKLLSLLFFICSVCPFRSLVQCQH